MNQNANEQRRFAGQVALVTGGGQGIGREISLRLAREGADLAIFDLREETMRSVAGEVEALGRSCLPLQVDITKPAAVEGAVAKVLERFGQIDILVNNAGIGGAKRFLDQTLEEWERMFAVNVFGVFNCCRAVIGHMQQRQRGNVVNISSGAGKLGSPFIAPYGATKAAVINLTQSLAREFAPHIRVNAVCPGFLMTEFWQEQKVRFADIRGLTPDEVVRQRAAIIPLGRPQTPEDVAGVVAFLASEDASAMTGQAINVTGGVEMR